MLETCPECNVTYYVPSIHRCDPIWEFNIPDCDGEDEWTEIRGYDAEVVAEAATASYDQDDHYLIRTGNSITINVRDPETG